MSFSLILINISYLIFIISTQPLTNPNTIPHGYQIRERGYIYIKLDILITILLSMIIFLIGLCIYLHHTTYHNTSKNTTTTTSTSTSIKQESSTIIDISKNESINISNISTIINEGDTILPQTNINNRLYSVSSPISTPKKNNNNISQINNISIKLPPPPPKTPKIVNKDMGLYKLKKHTSSSIVMHINKTFGQKDISSSDDDDEDSLPSPTLPKQMKNCKSNVFNFNDDNTQSSENERKINNNNENMNDSDKSDYNEILTMYDDEIDNNDENIPFNDKDISVNENDIRYVIENENIQGINKKLKNWEE